jgi:riboflavin synthase
MFTGIIEEIGSIASMRPTGGGYTLGISAPASIGELEINDSIAVNGVCLTVVSKSGTVFDAVAVEETLKKTSLGKLKQGSSVNLELPLRFNDRLGGHLILGHVDTTGIITGREDRQTSWMFTIEVPEEFRKYTVPVGSISIDGVSLTIAELATSGVRVSIIPHTMEKTLFGSYRVNDIVNLEFDIVGKYIERMVFPQQGEGAPQKSRLTEQQLREAGF